jgi:ABC-type sugar transport system permease subunit
MLESLPALTSLLAVLCYAIFRRRSSLARNGFATTVWLILSAIALGLTAASKYMYCIAGLAIVADWGLSAVAASRSGTHSSVVRDTRYATRSLFLWGFIALVVFFAANPRMWSDPFARLAQSVSYHGSYAQSAHVRQANFPFWQPLVWLLGPVPWHPGVFILMVDTVVTLLAGLGLGRLWRDHRVFAIWLALGLGFLLIWPTKWPQYILMITVPLSLAAGLGIQGAICQPLLAALKRRAASASAPSRIDPHVLEARRVARRDTRRAVPWLVPGIIALGLLALFPLVYQVAMSLTDFNAISIRDGIRGGVWRAVWEGVTGQAKPAAVSIFDTLTRSKEVHWAGPKVLMQLLGGAAPDLLAFNLIWAALSVGLQALLGVAAALMLNRRGVRWRRFWRTIFILPWAIPEFVGALVWLRILEPEFGWLALARGVPADALRSQGALGPDATLLQLLIAATWYGFPFIMLAATAALKLTPAEVYDAAAIDGAAGWQQFRWITWPLLLPLLAPAILVRSIFAFNQFYLFYTMRAGPPTITLATASFYLLSPTGPFGGQFAVAAAINIFTVFVLLGLIVWLARWTRSEATEEVTYA